jgi:hypothetical protein
MAFGVMQAGRLALREDATAEFGVDEDGVGVSIAGQESIGRLTLAQVQQRVDDVVALRGTMMAFTFTQKPEMDGYYFVKEASSTYTKWVPESAAILPWSLNLVRLGYANTLDLEARLSGPTTRANDHLATGERWHAPNIGHLAYGAGSTAPSLMTRASTDGAMTVYRVLAAGTNPKWASAPADYLKGRVRFVDTLGERQASQVQTTATGWAVDNGIVKVSVNPANGNLILSHWSGSVWQAKEFQVKHSTGPAVVMGVPDYCTVLRNTLECVVVRLTKGLAPGRVTVDLTLRRGSRFVEVYVQHQFGTTLVLQRATAEATSASTGYLTATAADANGHKFVLGSTRTFVADNVQGGLSKAATPVLDAYLGVSPSGAASGDLPADLFKQYLGVQSETVQGVRR